jgi:hypothetical protein
MEATSGEPCGDTAELLLLIMRQTSPTALGERKKKTQFLTAALGKLVGKVGSHQKFHDICSTHKSAYTNMLVM